MTHARQDSLADGGCGASAQSDEDEALDLQDSWLIRGHGEQGVEHVQSVGARGCL